MSHVPENAGKGKWFLVTSLMCVSVCDFLQKKLCWEGMPSALSGEEVLVGQEVLAAQVWCWQLCPLWVRTPLNQCSGPGQGVPRTAEQGKA